MLNKLKALGPGLLYAGAAVGVSHIVQSTKAGAEFGYILILGIVFAHIFKYPFFELGPAYTQHHGKNLLHGYKAIGNWALVVITVLTVATMFTIQAAVTIVTAGLAIKITGLDISPAAMSGVLLLICLLIIWIGRYNVLDKLMKIIMITLSVTTVVAVVSSMTYAHQIVPGTAKIFDLSNNQHIIFLIAFLGWMPAPLDIAIWHSIWSEEDAKRGNKPKGMLDFKVGFWGTALLGVGFLMLGANVIYGTGIELAKGGVAYAQQLLDIYVQAIGPWSYSIIAIAAFTTMFSTTLTCLDAMPRVLNKIIGMSSKKHEGSLDQDIDAPALLEHRNRRILLTALIAVGATVLLTFFVQNMTEMVNMATSISFITAPVLAWLAVLVVKRQMPEGFWSTGKRVIAYLGIFFLVLLSAFYIKLVMFG